MLILFIFSLLIFFNDGAGKVMAENKVDATSKCKKYTGFQFIEQKKYVWVCAPKERADIIENGITKGKYSGVDYVVSDFNIIKFPPAFFENKNGEISINNISMGNHTTAVVDKNGNVFMGGFIRYFD
jgi:hypothetical protein